MHAGFLRSWSKESINDRVVCEVQRIVCAMQAEGRRVKVLVTGATMSESLCKRLLPIARLRLSALINLLPAHCGQAQEPSLPGQYVSAAMLQEDGRVD